MAAMGTQIISNSTALNCAGACNYSSNNNKSNAIDSDSFLTMVMAFSVQEGTSGSEIIPDGTADQIEKKDKSTSSSNRKQSKCDKANDDTPSAANYLTPQDQISLTAGTDNTGSAAIQTTSLSEKASSVAEPGKASNVRDAQQTSTISEDSTILSDTAHQIGTASTAKPEQSTVASSPDTKQSVGKSDVKSDAPLNTNTTPAADGATRVSSATQPTTNEQSETATIRFYSQTSLGNDTLSTDTSTGQQLNPMQLVTGFEPNSTVLVKGFNYSSDAALTGKVMSSAEMSLQETLVQNASTESALNKIGGSFGETGSQLNQDSQFQEGVFTFMRDGTVSFVSGTNSLPAQTTGTLSLGNASWPTELAQWIGDLSSQHTSQLSLELNPKQLGRIFLRIETDKNEVRATISTESEHVKDLLNQGSSALRQQLESQGLVLGQLTIDVSQGGDGRPFQTGTGAEGSQARRSARSTQQNQPTQDLTTALSGQGGHDGLISIFA